MKKTETTSQFSIKYRPHTWEDVYGQDEIVKQLKQRIISDNIPKAVLFQGKYGTGKSTLAQIFAAAIQDHLEDGNPNWESQHTIPILNETFSRDTIRLDGSQLSTKEDVIQFTSNLKTKPIYDRKRICIIEETDQLSTAAQNALLKVLEDPNASTHFILLSMLDKQGVSPAIKSRCQVYNVKDISVKDLMFAMRNVMQKDGTWESDDIPSEFKTRGLATIASASQGSLRMALQYLEACITAQAWNEKDISALLNVTDEYSIRQILRALLEKTNDYDVWTSIFKTYGADHLYNYMSMMLAEAMLWKQTGFQYNENNSDIPYLGNHPNCEKLFYCLTMHPALNKPYMRQTDLIGALVSYYQGVDYRPNQNSTLVVQKPQTLATPTSVVQTPPPSVPQSVKTTEAVKETPQSSPALARRVVRQPQSVTPSPTPEPAPQEKVTESVPQQRVVRRQVPQTDPQTTNINNGKNPVVNLKMLSALDNLPF